MKGALSTTSAQPCSLGRSSRSNMCPPTSRGSVAYRPKTMERRRDSGSTRTSSSSNCTKSLSGRCSVSCMARANPPEPPRFGWRMTCRVSPSRAATASKPSWSDDELGTLVDKEDAIDEIDRIRRVGEGGQRLNAIVRLVVGRDAERRFAGACGLLLGGPFSTLEYRVLLVRHDVEPDPPTVAELRQREIERCRGFTVNLPACRCAAGRLRRSSGRRESSQDRPCGR